MLHYHPLIFQYLKKKIVQILSHTFGNKRKLEQSSISLAVSRSKPGADERSIEVLTELPLALVVVCVDPFSLPSSCGVGPFSRLSQRLARSFPPDCVRPESYRYEELEHV